MPRASELLGRSPVQPGMSEIEAAEQISDYIGRVVDATGGGDEADVDIFNGNLPGVQAEAPAAASPETEESDQRDQRRPDAASGDADGEQADSDDDGDAAADASQDEAQQDDEGADAQVQLEASQLAEMLGIDADALVVDEDTGAIQLRYKVGDEQGATNLQDVLASYQLQRHVNQKSERLSEQQRQLEEAALRRDQELQQAIELATSFQQAAEDTVIDRYAKVDWDKLRSEDPGRAAALQLELHAEVQAIRTRAEQVRQSYAEQQQRQQQEREQRHQQWLGEQWRHLEKHIPELADDTKRESVLRGYQDYLTGYGFTPQEIQALQDHRYLRVVADAVAYSSGRKQTEEIAAAPAAKRLLRVPKVARGGSPRGEEGARRDNRNRAASALRKSGSDEDAARFAVESGVVDAMLD